MKERQNGHPNTHSRGGRRLTKRWTLVSGPTLIPNPIDNRRFKQILAEVTQMLYEYYRQLQKREIPPSVNIDTAQSVETQYSPHRRSHVCTAGRKVS